MPKRPRPEHRNAFGDLLVPPDALPSEERIALLLRAAQDLRVNKKLAPSVSEWLGRLVDEHVETGADLPALLGVEAVRGRHKTTLQGFVAGRRHSDLLLRFSVAVGGDRRATRILAGKEACPQGAESIFEELQASKGPKSLSAFSRARARGVSRHPMS